LATLIHGSLQQRIRQKAPVYRLLTNLFTVLDAYPLTRIDVVQKLVQRTLYSQPSI